MRFALPAGELFESARRLRQRVLPSQYGFAPLLGAKCDARRLHQRVAHIWLRQPSQKPHRLEKSRSNDNPGYALWYKLADARVARNAARKLPPRTQALIIREYFSPQTTRQKRASIDGINCEERQAVCREIGFASLRDKAHRWLVNQNSIWY